MAEGMIDLSPNRGNGQNPAPATQPEQIPYEIHKSEDRRWLVLLIYGLSALIVAAVIVLSARWVYRQANNTATNSKPNSAQNKNNSNTKQAPSASKESEDKSSSSNQNQGSNTPPAPAPTPTPTPPPANPGAGSNQLPNTGG